MIIELSNGHKAELRDKLKAKDYRMVHEAVTLRQNEDGSREISMAVDNAAKRALIVSMTQHWDLPGFPPRPSEAADTQACLDELDEEDWTALAEAVGPAYDKIMGIKRDPKETTGIGQSPVIPGEVISGTSSSAA